MEIVEGLKLFTALTGITVTGSEFLSYYLKKYINKDDKLATAHLVEKDAIESIIGDTGLVISRDIQLKEKYDYEGSVIFAPTGAGKTTSFFIPNLLNDSIKGSIIATDPKGELFKISSKFQEKVCKRRVFKFSPLQPEKSEKYNLLTSCKSNTEVVELASTLLFNGALSIELATGKKASGAEWIQMSEALLCSALLYVKGLGYPYDNIEFAFKLLISLNTEQLDTIFSKSDNVDVITQWNIFKSVGKADRTEGSIKITMASNIKLFTDSRINMAGIENSFDIESFRKEPSILYVTYPENKSAYLAPFIAPFFSQAIDKIIDKYNDDSLPIHLFFDEFGNIGMLNNMSINAATIRSRRGSLNICLQSITQLYQTYGRENAKAILNNLKTKLVLPGLTDIDTLNFVSSICGEKEITVCNTNINKQSTSRNYSKAKVKLFENSQLRCLDDDEVLIITSNKQPIISKQNRYYDNAKYQKNIFRCTADIPNSNNDENYPVRLEKKILDLKLQSILESEVEDVRTELFK